MIYIIIITISFNEKLIATQYQKKIFVFWESTNSCMVAKLKKMASKPWV